MAVPEASSPPPPLPLLLPLPLPLPPTTTTATTKPWVQFPGMTIVSNNHCSGTMGPNHDNENIQAGARPT